MPDLMGGHLRRYLKIRKIYLLIFFSNLISKIYIQILSSLSDGGGRNQSVRYFFNTFFFICSFKFILFYLVVKERKKEIVYLAIQ